MSNQMDTMVKTIIEAQVIQALKSAPDAIEAMVKAALSQPVSENGDTRGYGNKMPYLDYIVGDAIREAARRAVHKVVQESSEQIEAQVRKGLSSETVVAALTKSLVNSVNEDWRIKVEFAAEPSR